MRPPIERYVRASVDILGSKRRVEGCVELGLLYLPPGERPSAFRTEMRECAEAALRDLHGRWESQFDEDLADAIQGVIDRRMIALWGDRPRFIEVWRGTGADEEALTQTYAPFGMPMRGRVLTVTADELLPLGAKLPDGACRICGGCGAMTTCSRWNPRASEPCERCGGTGRTASP